MMQTTDISKRTFLRAAAAAGVSWIAADLAGVERALAFAGAQAGQPLTALSVLTADEAAAIDAMTARILPAVDGRPGARDAGVIYFIDRALSSFNAGERKLYAAGVRDLNVRATRAKKKPTTFAGLTTAEQDVVLHAIEKAPFFQTVRMETLVGMFALPTWGGNKDHIGWHLLGLDHQPAFQPPFGYYDAEANRRI